MARDGVLTLFNIDDAKISRLTADTASALTYANAKDVPGITKIGIKPVYLNKELKGDAKILDTYSKCEKITVSVSHAQISLDVLEVLTGGTNTDSGTTPNEKRTFTLKGAHLPNFFKLEGQIKYMGGPDAGGSGDSHHILKKGKCTSWEVEFQNEEYAIVSFEADFFPTINDDIILELVENETTVAITTTADSTAPSVSSVTPADAATGVSVSANIEWTFSEALRLDSITTANFMVTTAAGVDVPGAVSYNSGTFVVTFNPTSNMGASTAHIAIVSPNVRDEAGNAMAAPHYTNFTTA